MVDSFAAEIQIIGYIQHRNIVRLIGYCSNGNLRQLLEGNRNLDWKTRYKIAVCSAQGLSGRVMYSYEAYIADVGLAKLINSPNYHHAMSRVAGSYGYIAPEKSDVYSYGVVLLEILSGRSAVESQHAGDGQHIVEGVKKKMASSEPAVSILDTKLQSLPDQMQQEMFKHLELLCFVPVERPTMKEVVALLMEVKCQPHEEMGKTSQPLIKQSSTQC